MGEFGWGEEGREGGEEGSLRVEEVGISMFECGLFSIL